LLNKTQNQKLETIEGSLPALVPVIIEETHATAGHNSKEINSVIERQVDFFVPSQTEKKTKACRFHSF
jgi:hypothetical protein